MRPPSKFGFIRIKLFVPNVVRGPHFIAEFLHQLLALGLLDQTSAASINPTLQNDFHPRIQTEAQEHGSDMEVRRFDPCPIATVGSIHRTDILGISLRLRREPRRHGFNDREGLARSMQPSDICRYYQQGELHPLYSCLRLQADSAYSVSEQLLHLTISKHLGMYAKCCIPTNTPFRSSPYMSKSQN